MSRILVIDDDSGNRLIVKSRLSDLGFEVLPVENGAQGLVQSREAGLDLVLVASGLGSGIDAVEVCRRLKASPGTQAVPVLIYSNLPAGGEEIARAYEAGCDAFLPKNEMMVLDHIVRAHLRNRAMREDLAEQNRVLERENQRLREERQQSADIVVATHSTGERALALRELAAASPDGMLLVDGDGYVQRADRGASEFFGSRVEGQNLGRLAPATGLEAFVRDARAESREGFRFDLSAIGGRVARSLTASVFPLLQPAGGEGGGLKVVLLLDAGRRRIAAEMLRVHEPGIPRAQLGPLLEIARQAFHPRELVGRSEAFARVRTLVEHAADQDRPLLLFGEPGTGKDHVAQTLHFASSRSGGLFRVSCAGLSPDGIERELFGYVPGAFPEALAERPGVLHLAADGTVVLEELSDLPFTIQERLVPWITDGVVRRVGSERDERVRARLIATSRRDPQQQVEQGRILPELLDVLEAGLVRIPPLRERADDVHLLALHFLARLGTPLGVTRITDETLALLGEHLWPGNVAELRESIAEACEQSENGTVTPDCLPQALRDACEGLVQHELTPRAKVDAVEGTHSVGAEVAGDEGTRVHRRRPWDITEDDPISLEHYEKMALLRALHASSGDKLAAARLLGVGKSTLYRKLKRFGIK